MRPSVSICSDPAQIGWILAGTIGWVYSQASWPFLLGCPGGRSLRTTYAALAQSGRPFERLVVVMMDEYLDAPPDAHYSCTRFAHDDIAGPLGIPPEGVWLPDPEDPAAYDERIRKAGGIDLFLLAAGASDGHVAFLGPGSPLDGQTAVVEIAETTRRDNLVTFPEFASIDDVPTRGVSVGLGTILRARAVRLVLHGADKRATARRLLALDHFDPDFPASVVYEHENAGIYIDEEARP